jgi:hypothetical protein
MVTQSVIVLCGISLLLGATLTPWLHSSTSYSERESQAAATNVRYELSERKS